MSPSRKTKPLAEYQRKRDFKQTPEPSGKTTASKQAGALRFVVHKHAARHLHYDFRLEMDGVLRSWAIPKGLPLARGEKRLAVQVEDHPLDYGEFEGTIAPGNYGAGTVMLWDQGTYQSLDNSPVEAWSNGHLRLHLHGEKLKGDWSLVRLKPRAPGTQTQWLILKRGEDLTSIPADDHSVKSNRTMEAIAQGNRPESAKPKALPRTRITPSKSTNAKGLSKSEPKFIEPMKVLLVDQVPQGHSWIYEIKFDGYRAIAVKNGKQVTIYSRLNHEFTHRYPPITQALTQVPARRVVLDGEIVALDAEGKPQFQLLQNYGNVREKGPLLYYVFDLLHLDGKDLTKLPLVERKEQLEKLMAAMGKGDIRFSANIEGAEEAVRSAMRAQGLEGMIAKQRLSPYAPGMRNGAWVKVKWHSEQEFVIGGYTRPKGIRSHFGAILVGYYADGELKFAGKVGTGFDQERLSQLYHQFQPYRQDQCPFADLPDPTPPGITASAMRLCTWLQPKLVCQVRFTQWTRDDRLRQPVFVELREDKAAREVVREKVGKPTTT